MKSYINFLNRYPKSKVWVAKRYLKDPKNRADLYVNKIQSFILNKMDENNWTYEKLGKKTGVTKSAVSQMLNSDSSIKVHTLFKFLEGLEYTLELPKIAYVDVDALCEDYLNEVNTIEVHKNNTSRSLERNSDLSLYVTNIHENEASKIGVLNNTRIAL